MKQTAKITVSAISAALAIALMFALRFPYLTYTIPAVAGLFMMIPLISANAKWAFAAYTVSAVIAVAVCDPETAWIYVFLFGYYPIVKALIERINRPVIEWIIKIAVLNIAVVAFYNVAILIVGASFDDFGDLGKYGLYITWAMANAAFVIYDIAVSKLAVLYLKRVHPKIEKIFKI